MDLRGNELFVTDDGEGPTLLMVHGFGCDADDWIWQIAGFESSHRVVAPDLRGHGRSPMHEGGFSMAALAADLARLVEALDCGPVVALGHSMGAVVASVLAIERPDLVGGLIAIAPGYLVPEGARPVVERTGRDLDAGDAIAVVHGLFASSYTGATPPQLPVWHRRRVERMPPQVLRATYAAMFDGPDAPCVGAASERLLQRRACPVLAFHTSEGRAGLERAVLGSDPRSRVVVWEGSGHWVHQERPREINLLIADWLTSLEPW